MFSNRIKNCIKRLKALSLEALLVSDPLNLSYLSGFRQAEGYLLVTREAKTYYFTNFLYRDEAKAAGFDEIIIADGSYFDLISKAIRRQHLKNVGFEAKSLAFLEYSRLKEILSKDQIDFIRTIDFVESLRAIKTEKELSLIKRAIAISKSAFVYIEEICDELMTEKDLTIEIEKFLKLKGDNAVAFAPIVAAGKNSALPHHLAGDERIKTAVCLVDLGAKDCGYCADLTRVFFWSKMPQQTRKIYDIVQSAQNLAIKKIKEGISANEVDRAARSFIEKKGFGKFFGHGLGHGVGLAVHEPPFINFKNEQVLREGMVLTVEPAIYLPAKFGIRVEEMILVKKDKAEVLSGILHF